MIADVSMSVRKHYCQDLKKEEKQLVKKDEVPAEETVETKKEETPAVES